MGSSERNQRIQSSRTQTSNMKTLLLLSILGLALISADLQTEEDRYIEEADVVAVDDSAEAMDDLKDEMEDSRRKRKRPTRTYYRANFNANEPIAAPTDGVVTSPSSQQTQIESFNKQTAQIVYFAPNGENDVTGTVTASTTSAGELKFEWDLAGLQESTDASGKNGIHIHYGTSCASEVTVKGDAPSAHPTNPADPDYNPALNANKGHYYNPATSYQNSDPWANVKYISDAAGKSTDYVTIPGSSLGAADFSAFSRVVIVHNKDGSKRGCGLLAPSNTVMGTVNAFVKGNKLRVKWQLEGLEDGITGDEGLPRGKNGIHIHYGKSCDSETSVKGDAPTDASKGHYYNPSGNLADPWGPVKWECDADGTSTGARAVELTAAQLGAPLESAFDRVVIVHNSFGTKVGCGVLSASRKTKAKGIFRMQICNDGSFARYKVNLKGEVADAEELNFHLHSAYTANAAAGTVGGSGTSGHYDPDFKCGGASSNQGTQECEDENAAFTYPANGCERGDLSCKMGPVKVRTSKRFSGGKVMGGVNRNWKKGWSPKDTNPPLNTDFSDVGGSTTGAKFASVVFHKGSARVFGARLMETTPRSTLEAIFHSDNLQGNVEVSQRWDTTWQVKWDRIRLRALGCPEGSTLKWHIHDKWTHPNDQDDAYGADCGSDFTGGHWDPTYKCGPASDNSKEICKTQYNEINSPAQSPCDGSIERGCNYKCSSTGQGCELGDLSGKTRQVLAKGRGRKKHQFFPDPNIGNIQLIEGKSIVFHCGVGSATRVACAKLVSV